MNTHDLPAILGGAPAFPGGPPPWPPAWPDVQDAVRNALKDGSWGQYHGPQLQAFEAELASFFKVPHVLTCASGTLAVEVALRAAAVGLEDEVVLSAYEYESNFLTIHALGARPVLVDVDGLNGNLDPDQLDEVCSSKTKAIVCSHLHGGLIPISAVRSFARSRQILLIEDAAQATGATVEGNRAGAGGDAGILSFGGSKLLSAGRGGAILFQETKYYQRAKLWLQRGVQSWAPLSELQAIVLRPQLARLEQDAQHRRDQVLHLQHQLEKSSISGLRLFENRPELGRPDYYKVGFILDSQQFGLDATLFVRALRAEGIAFDPGFKPLHLGRSPSRFHMPVPLDRATRMQNSCVKLHHPILAEASEETMAHVARTLTKVYRNADRICSETRPSQKDAT